MVILKFIVLFSSGFSFILGSSSLVGEILTALVDAISKEEVEYNLTRAIIYFSLSLLAFLSYFLFLSDL